MSIARETMVRQTGGQDDMLRMYDYYPYKGLLKSLLARKQGKVITDGYSAIIIWGPSLMVGGVCSAFVLDKLGALLNDSMNERFLYLPDDEWIPRIQCTVPGQIEEKQINVYVANTAYSDIRKDDCIVPVTASLLESKAENIQSITDELYSYLSLEDFHKTGFGLVLVKDHKVCGYCLSEYSIDGACGINIWIDEKYRGHGYAKAMTQRFLIHSQQKQWKVFWGCFSDNVASNHVALSCGFELFARQSAWVHQSIAPIQPSIGSDPIRS